MLVNVIVHGASHICSPEAVEMVAKVDSPHIKFLSFLISKFESSTTLAFLKKKQALSAKIWLVVSFKFRRLSAWLAKGTPWL